VSARRLATLTTYSPSMFLLSKKATTVKVHSFNKLVHITILRSAAPLLCVTRLRQIFLCLFHSQLLDQALCLVLLVFLNLFFPCHFLRQGHLPLSTMLRRFCHQTVHLHLLSTLAPFHLLHTLFELMNLILIISPWSLLTACTSRKCTPVRVRLIMLLLYILIRLPKTRFYLNLTPRSTTRSTSVGSHSIVNAWSHLHCLNHQPLLMTDLSIRLHLLTTTTNADHFVWW